MTNKRKYVFCLVAQRLGTLKFLVNIFIFICFEREVCLQNICAKSFDQYFIAIYSIILRTRRWKTKEWKFG